MVLRRHLGLHRSFPASLLTLVLTTLVGCGTAPIPGTDDISRPQPGEDSGENPQSEQDPSDGPADSGAGRNSVFTDAQPATLPGVGAISIGGTIDFDGDVDIWALGPAVMGDRIIVEVTGHNGLNTVAALFDGNGDLIDANDDRSYYAGQIDPYIAQVVRAEAPDLYLGIAVSRATHFASSAGRYETGSYSVAITRQSGATMPRPRHQLVYLSFQGGDRVQIGLEPIEVMRPFSATAISSRFEGRKDDIIDLVTDEMGQDFAAVDVTLLDSRYNAVPSEPHSTLYFGNYNANYLGLADNVDTGNMYLEQEAIIYAEDLVLFESLQPSVEETALALANIAAHELGHLLGLEHSAEAGDLMATAATARQILEIDAAFSRARLQETVFPMGWQNAPELLLLNVGGAPGAANARLRIEDLLPKLRPAFRDALDDIPIVQCGRCSGHTAGDDE